MRIRDGTYGSQTISSGSKTLSYIGSLSGVTLTGELTINGSNVTMDGFSTTTSTTRGLHVNGANATITNFSVNSVYGDGRADGLELTHGSIGPNNGCSGPEDGAMFGNFPGGGGNTLDDLLMDHISLHGTTGYTQCGQHMDGIQGFGCTNWTIRNSHFYDNDTSHILCLAHDTTNGATGPNNILLENNQFGRVNNLGSLIIFYCGTSDPNNMIIRNNTFFDAGAISLRGDTDISGSTCGNGVNFYNNYVTSSNSCNFGSGNVVAHHNVFTSGSCGSNTKTCTATFVDSNRYSTGNGDIVANDPCVKNAANPERYPVTDIHGSLRWAPDVGATAVTRRPSKTKLLARRTKYKGCQARRSVLPDRACTPGAIYTDAALPIVCARGYAARALDVNKETRKVVYAAYRVRRPNSGRPYQIDHVVPLELGGSNDAANLFPEAASNPPSRYQAKNTLERRLYELVCSGKRSLRPTQRAIARDWLTLYRQIFGRYPI